MLWPLQDHHDRLNQVVEEARRSGPQVITRDGREMAIVLMIEEYRRLLPLIKIYSNLHEVE